jgi:hypothetical protein
MRPVRPIDSDMPLPLAYFVVLVLQLPLWVFIGLILAVIMAVETRSHPIGALIRGLAWSCIMWVVMGNLMAIGLVWRRSTVFPVADQATFRTALERACRKLRLIVLAESADIVVLGPKWTLVRLRLQEVRIKLVDRTAVLTAPALSFGAIRKQVGQALAEADAEAEQASRGQVHGGPGAAADRPGE